jgi:hypothetical protein
METIPSCDNGYDRKLYGHQIGTDHTVSEPYSQQPKASMAQVRYFGW